MYLWVNLCDLSAVGPIGPFGSFLNLMILPSDELLPGAFYRPKGNLDDNFVVIGTTQERAEAIQGGLDVIGQRKIGRKIRTRITTNPPGKGWVKTGG